MLDLGRICLTMLDEFNILNSKRVNIFLPMSDHLFKAKKEPNVEIMSPN